MLFQTNQTKGKINGEYFWELSNFCWCKAQATILQSLQLAFSIAVLQQSVDVR